MQGRKDLIGADSELDLANDVGVALSTSFGSGGKSVEHVESCGPPEEFECVIEHALAGAHDE